MTIMKRMPLPIFVASLYLNSGWFPAVVALTAFIALMCAILVHWRPNPIVLIVIAIMLGVSFLGTLSASTLSFFKRRWSKGIVNLLAVPVYGLAIACVSGLRPGDQGQDLSSITQRKE